MKHLHVRPRPFQRRVIALASTALAIGATLSGPAVGHADQPPAGTVSLLGHAPNWFAGRLSSEAFEVDTAPLLDSVNHLLFEFNGFGQCQPAPYFVRLDVDTFATQAVQPCGGTGTYTLNEDQGGGGPATPVAAFDSTDRIMFGSELAAPGTDDVAVISEDTLAKTRSLSLPSTVPPHASGLSWYAPTDELLVTGTLASVDGASPTVWISAYDARATLASGSLVLRWAEPVPQCQGLMQPSFGSPAAYHATGEPAVYVPCRLLDVGYATAGETSEGVVKVVLGSVDPRTGAACAECPDGQASVAVAPGATGDAFFDAGVDRTFMPVETTTASALVYDGHSGRFEGKVDFGNADGPDARNGAVIGLDPTSGRVYAFDVTALWVVEGRRTPVQPGTEYPQYAANVDSGGTVALPPDARYPFTRLLGPDFTKSTAVGGPYAQPDFNVFADTTPASTDPPAAAIDSRTHSGAVPPGAQVNTVYTATARGFGVHADWISAAKGALEDQFIRQAPDTQLTVGTRDLMAGFVDHVQVGAGGITAAASALGDANGTTAESYQTCSDWSAYASCVPALSGSASPPSSPPSTGQPWPFPTAVCSQPGDASAARDSVVGVDISEPGATPGVAPGSDRSQASTADVDCSGRAPLGGATGTAHFGGAIQPPLISVSAADATSTVRPPSGNLPTTAHTTATARSFELDLGSAGTLSIAAVTQSADAISAGSAGSALTHRAVAIENVAIDGASICTTSCDPHQVAAAVDEAFPDVVEVILPQPATPFGAAADGSPAGSPGGYQAVVKSDVDEQNGDEDFNGMRAEEAAILPALRLVVHSLNDGNPAQSRLIVDLAGVEDDAQTGIQVAPAEAGFDGGDSSTSGVPVDTTAGAAYAGVQSIPAVAASSPGAVAPSPSGGITGVILRSFRGLSWLLSSPGRAVQMGAFLLLLGSPAVSVRRRWARRAARGGGGR